MVPVVPMALTKCVIRPAVCCQISGPVVGIIGAVGAGLLLLVGPVVLIVAAKALRRHQRRRAEPARALTGSWDEVVDLATDAGIDVPVHLTRQEAAWMLADEFGPPSKVGSAGKGPAVEAGSIPVPKINSPSETALPPGAGPPLKAGPTSEVGPSPEAGSVPEAGPPMDTGPVLEADPTPETSFTWKRAKPSPRLHDTQ